jgi:hypothetical protein
MTKITVDSVKNNPSFIINSAMCFGPTGQHDGDLLAQNMLLS